MVDELLDAWRKRSGDEECDANTGGDRDGRVFECPDCGARVLVTAGLLVGGERMRLLSPQGQD